MSNKSGVTEYTSRETRVLTPFGQLITLSKIKIDIPAYIEIKNGVIVSKDVDVTGTMSIKTHTIHALTTMALAAGSWEEIAPFDFINVDIMPNDGVGIPFLITLENVKIIMSIPELNLIEGEGLVHEIPFVVGGNTRVGGAKINKERPVFGI